MQNIPGIAYEKATEQMQTVKIAPVKTSDQQELFADLFREHAAMVDEELSLAPVAQTDKMIDSTPQMTTGETPANTAGTETSAEKDVEVSVHDNDTRMTQEDFDEVKDDLEEYGMTKEEIAEIEEQVNSEEGMTWGQFVTAIAQKMAESGKVQLSDEQKGKLQSFFGKFGFTAKESEGLIENLKKGDFSKVMKALQAKIDAMPQDKQLLIDKQEIEAFTAAMGFSKEFTAKIKELFGSNTLPKEVKQAFTMIRQEMADMDKREQDLAKAIGKVMAKALGDESKASSLSRQIAEAVDLKPRVAENAEAGIEAKEDLAQAIQNRKDAMPETAVRKTTDENLANKAEVKGQTDATVKDAVEDTQDNESGDHWNDMFGKMTDDGSAQNQAQNQAQIKTQAAEALSKAGLTEAAADTKSKADAWEKVSAPKLMKQVDNAVLRTLNSGAKQLTLQLTPENLGKMSIVLSTQGKEVSATIRAESPEAARLIADNIDIIKSSLENQGLKVEKLEVQAGLTENQDYQDWFGENEHNLAHEREAMIAMRNHMKQMREGNGGGVAQDMQQLREQAINAAHGLHVIA